MILLLPPWRPGCQRTHPRELSDLAWRSALGLARAQGVTPSDPSRVDAADAERLAAASATLPRLTFREWFRACDHALRRRSDLRPEVY